MSRIGKKPIKIPEGTTVDISPGLINIRGPLGELSLSLKPVVDVELNDNYLTLKPKNNELETTAMWGTYVSLLCNMVDGVNRGYEKRLKIVGVGYKAEMKGDKLVLNIGFSHPLELSIDPDIKCVVEKDTIIISGIDKEKVSQFAAIVRSKKKPEPYKGKGIRYDGEIVRRKEGKKSV